MRKLSMFFAALAILLTNVMCVVVAYNCTALHCNPLNSAPWDVGLLYAIPFVIGIIACSVVSFSAKKRENKMIQKKEKTLEEQRGLSKKASPQNLSRRKQRKGIFKRIEKKV